MSGAGALGIWTRDSDNTVDLSGTVLSAQAEAVRMGGDKDEDTLAVLTTEAACCPCKIAPEACPTWPKPKCLWDITPEQVLEKCEELLER